MKYKVILVFYVDIGNLPDKDIAEYMSKLKEKIEFKEDDILSFFVPIRGRGEGSRVECIYPKFITSEQVEKESLVMMDGLREMYVRILEEYNK